jgi:hypothetical protein
VSEIGDAGAMPRSLRLFTVAIGLSIATALAGQAMRTDGGSTVGPIALGVGLHAAIWVFASRGHRWPWIAVAVLNTIAVVFEVTALDRRMLLAIGDILSLYVLWLGWRTRFRESEPLAVNDL